MGKLKVIKKEVNLKEFRRRACTACGNQLMVESYNGRVHGKYGHSQGKLLTCKTCSLLYFYDFNGFKYIIDRICYHIKEHELDVYIDYTGRLRKDFGFSNGDKKDNVLIVLGSNTHLFFHRVWGLPKKKMLKLLASKAELYAIFG